MKQLQSETKLISKGDENMDNTYSEHKAKVQARQDRAEQIKEISNNVAKLIVDSDVAINEVWTILHLAEEKIKSTTKATI